MPPKEITPDAFSPDVREFLALLRKHGVRFVIVGGHAAIFHGHVRITGDTDVFYDGSDENCAKLYKALGDFWAGDIPGVAAAAELETPGVVTQFGRPPNRLDLINRIDGVAFAECWDQRDEAFFRDGATTTSVPILNRSCLLKNKRASGRPKDLDDLEALGGN